MCPGYLLTIFVIVSVWYELFQEWMNNCPVDILHYEDHVDTVNVRFELPLEEIVDNEEEQSYVDSLLTNGTDYPPLVDTEATHDSEGC